MERALDVAMDAVMKMELGMIKIKTSEQIGKIVRDTRKALDLTQSMLALTSGTGQRFISDLENGKPTCQLGKTLIVLHTLGIKINFNGVGNDKAKKENEASNLS